MTSRLSKNFHGVGIGPLSKILTVNRLFLASVDYVIYGWSPKIETTESIFDVNDDEIQGVFALICKKVEDLEDINEICNYEISSEVLQCLLLVLCKKSGKLCKKLGKHITNEVFAGKYHRFFL